jgi:hypothetical protein
MNPYSNLSTFGFRRRQICSDKVVDKKGASCLLDYGYHVTGRLPKGQEYDAVRAENLNSGVVVVKPAKDGA